MVISIITAEFSKPKKQPYEEVVVYRMERAIEGDFFMEIAKFDHVKD